MASLNHVNATLRLMDANGKGIRTFTGVNPAITPAGIATLKSGINTVRSAADQVAGVLHTERAEIVKP